MFYDLFISVVFLLSSFTFNDFNEITNCNDDDIFEINCGFQNPEDLYLSPSNEKIIISEFGSLAPNTKYGNLSYFDLFRKEKKDFEISYESNDWGDVNPGTDNQSITFSSSNLSKFSAFSSCSVLPRRTSRTLEYPYSDM